MSSSVSAVLLFTFFVALNAHAAAPRRPFLEKHCLDCHDASEKKGGLNLDALPVGGADVAAQEAWVRVFDRVLAGEMPPKKKARPEAAAQRQFLTALGSDLVREHTARKGTVLRRLNRTEYENTLRDLLGVEVKLRDMLPGDTLVRGFENIGEALNISSVQLARYLEAAGVALDAAFTVGERPDSAPRKFTFEPAMARREQEKSEVSLTLPDGAIAYFTRGGYPKIEVPGFRTPMAGRYRVRFTGYAYQTAEALAFAAYSFSYGKGESTRFAGYAEMRPGAAQVAELEMELEQGEMLRIEPELPAGVRLLKDVGPEKYTGPGLAIAHAEIEGPLLGEWPARGHRLLYGDLPVKAAEKPKGGGRRNAKPAGEVLSADPAGDARKLLPDFVAAAFRRPATMPETAPFLALFDAEMKNGATFHEAMRTAASAVLCAPEFLYLREPPGRLDVFALASRLAYFLTRSGPDAELLKLAGNRQLAQPAELRAQTERLLKDARAHRFTADFTDSWLNLREIDFTTPDRMLYPEFDNLLQHSIVAETRGFFDELLRGNLGVANFLQSDFAMLDSRLAEHYGIPDVHGSTLRRVKLPPDSRRGGVLTHASVLKVSANGTSTSPVLRGAWVLERILGITPQPPPPGTPGVEPDIRGARTIREQLDQHRNLETCSVCHRHIDPPGFALESYDVIGGWRDRFRSLGTGDSVKTEIGGLKVRYKLGPPVNASGQMADGRAFTDFTEFQKLLLTAQPQFAKCLTEKLLTFATGRELGFSDRIEIARLVKEHTAKGGGLRDLVHLAVQSEIFLRK